MYYVPVTDNYYSLPTAYIPVYTTENDRRVIDDPNTRLKDELNRVQRDLTNLREELSDLRLENRSCRICSSSNRTNLCDETCLICYPRIRLREQEENYSRSSSPVHYCSICHDYVIAREYPPPPSPQLTRRYVIEESDKLSEYLSRQMDLRRLRQGYIPKEKPIWIPTAYKHDYPNRRWVTRHSNYSEP